MPSARLQAIYGASQGDHFLGAITKDAGVTVVAGPKLQFDTAAAHSFTPRQDTANATLPAGYSRGAWFWQFNYTISTGTVGATHSIFDHSVAVPHNLQIKEKTNRDLEFYLQGVLLYTYTPSATHHIYMSVMDGASPYGPTVAVGHEAWMLIEIDKTLVVNIRQVIVTTAFEPASGRPSFGEGSAVGGSSTAIFQIDNYSCGFTDRDDLIGKITCKNWGWTLATAPYKDESTKSSTGDATGDAADMINEIPPAASGTTDQDYYAVADTSTADEQTSVLADTLLAAGDVMYGLVLKAWDRAVSGPFGTLTNAQAYVHDGTNIATVSSFDTVTSPTSYAEHIYQNGPIMIYLAPDGAAWSSKANAYLDTVEAGIKMLASSSNFNSFRVDAIVMEAAIVLSGDTISNPADPPALATRRIFLC